MDIVLVLEELDGLASTCLDHTLKLVASSFNSLSEKMKKQAVSKSWRNRSDLVDMLNREYLLWLGSLFKNDEKAL